MMGWVIRILGLILILVAMYVILGVYGRWQERKRLTAQHSASNETEDKETYVQRGLHKYEKSIRSKLILGVFVLPAAVLGILIYLAHNN